MTIGEIIKEYCRSHNMSQRQFAIEAGTSNAYITMLIQGVNPRSGRPIVPTIEKYQGMAKAMGLSVDDLFDMMDDAPIKLKKQPNVDFLKTAELSVHKIPLIGSVAGGEPIYDEEIDLQIDGPTRATCAVKLKGDSMSPTYQDGDIIYIKELPDVRDGRIAVVFLEDEAVLKRVYHIKNGLQLLSDNPRYKPIIATNEEYSSIRILGIPCGFTRMYSNG